MQLNKIHVWIATIVTVVEGHDLSGFSIPGKLVSVFLSFPRYAPAAVNNVGEFYSTLLHLLSALFQSFQHKLRHQRM